ncbi:hypothetical protein M422DRAFT_276633 [Sphaerobolus stellatus SS14]|uniref:Uncharacterized protein n=1 Tax=Sphaerobolus stellatus (strain SS14) TaxID=990650 RepID=A0A0C9TM42_SPHS4|nr:hypothetical protein M422DRAFT_276633 [Sphaerobolus stellatus SS14]
MAEYVDTLGTLRLRDAIRVMGFSSIMRAHGALVDGLSPFQLLYPDGVERSGAENESARDRVRCVEAVWFGSSRPRRLSFRHLRPLAIAHALSARSAQSVPPTLTTSPALAPQAPSSFLLWTACLKSLRHLPPQSSQLVQASSNPQRAIHNRRASDDIVLGEDML